MQTTSGDGTATFHVQSAGPYQVRVLASGFAAETAEVQASDVVVNLRLASAAGRRWR